MKKFNLKNYFDNLSHLKKVLKIKSIDITFINNLLVTSLFMLFLVETPESINLDRFYEVIENEHLLKELLFLLLACFTWFQLFQFAYLDDNYDR